MDYLLQAVQAFLPMMARGPWHRETQLRLKFPNMSDDERNAAAQLAQVLAEGAITFEPTAAGLDRLFVQRGLANHFRRGRGNW